MGNKNLSTFVSKYSFDPNKEGTISLIIEIIPPLCCRHRETLKDIEQYVLFGEIVFSVCNINDYIIAKKLDKRIASLMISAIQKDSSLTALNFCKSIY